MRKSTAATAGIADIFVLTAETGSFAAGPAGATHAYSGKVTAVDPWGAGITVAVNAAEKTMTAGAIVGKVPSIRLGRKKASLKDIKPDDVVTITHLKSDGLYAKSIVGK